MSSNNQKKSFHQMMQERYPGDNITEDESRFMLQNLSDLVMLLYRINEREKIVSLEELAKDEHLYEAMCSQGSVEPNLKADDTCLLPKNGGEKL